MNKETKAKLKAFFASQFFDKSDISVPVGCETCGDTEEEMSIVIINRVIDAFDESKIS